MNEELTYKEIWDKLDMVERLLTRAPGPSVKDTGAYYAGVHDCVQIALVLVKNEVADMVPEFDGYKEGF